MDGCGRRASGHGRQRDADMKKTFLPFLLGLAGVVGVVRAFAAGESNDTDDVVVLGEVDLAERAEILRNRFRRMTPDDFPLVQDVGTWPSAWEEFGRAWDASPAEGDLATWLVPFAAERMGALTVLRDADGNVLWSGATDFAKEESANVTLTGWLVSEDDWPLYQAARAALARSLKVQTPHLRNGGGALTGLRFVSVAADFTNTPPEFRVGLVWTNSGTVDMFVYGLLHVAETNEVTYTNDENAVVTVTNVSWHSVEPSLSGFDNAWTWAGTLALTNSETNVFVDTSFTEDRAKVRFYAAAPVADTDSDGLNGGFEIFVSHSDPDSEDGDGDGLSDYDEYWTYHTNPSSSDSDHDGLNDATELALNLDPNDPDMDNDGLNDGDEYSLGTDPENSDSDYDGLPDGWEVHNNLNPLIATGDDGATGDPDGDGFSNMLEFELGAPANNAAWNGEEVAWKLTHFSATVTTNTRSGSTNWNGLRVDIEDAWNCSGSCHVRQNVTNCLYVPSLLECGYYIDLGIEGSVEDQNSGYDKVWFEAADNTLFFEGNNNFNGCSMVVKQATNQVLIMENTQVCLRYDTVGSMFHTGAYAKVVDAVVAAPYGVEIDGPDLMLVGDTIQMEAQSGIVGEAYTWSVDTPIASIDQEGLLTAITTGVVIVTAEAESGCTVSKEVAIAQIDFLNSNGFPLSAIKIGQWENAFDSGGAVKDNFVDLDPDCFRVRVIDPRQSGRGTIGVSLATITPSLAFDDNPTGIDLLEQPENSGVFISTNLLLVFDDIDDDFTNATVPVDDTRNDRTHRIALGCRVHVRYPESGTPFIIEQITLQPEATLHVIPVILRDEALNEGGVPVVGSSQVEAFLKNSKQKFSQLGINLTWEDLLVVDPPAGVNLTDGITIRTNSSSRKLAAEAKAAIAGIGTVGNLTDIHIIFANTLKTGDDFIGGSAVADYWYDESEEGYLYNVFMSRNDVVEWSGCVIAHECGHLLTDTGHVANTWQIMHNGAVLSGVTGSRRFVPSEETVIKGDSHVQ